jgi:hypothetical protein
LSPARPLFARRPRTLRYCCLSWGGAKASRNTLLRNGDKRRSHPRALGLLEACWGLQLRPICAPKRINSSAFKSCLIQADHSARLEQFAAFDLPTLLSPPVRFSRAPTKGSEVCGADSSVGLCSGYLPCQLSHGKPLFLCVHDGGGRTVQPDPRVTTPRACLLANTTPRRAGASLRGCAAGAIATCRWPTASWRGILAGQGGQND